MKKALIITYGCQMNINDSAKLKAKLIENGYKMTDILEEADAVFLNTCTVREGAAEKIYGKLGELKNLKSRKEGLIIGVTGCLAQEKKEDILKKNPHVNMIIGNQNIYKVSEYLSKIEENNIKHVLLIDDENALPPFINSEFESDITAFVSITYGCNNFCSYCIVPYVRGRERSAPFNEIVKEVSEYVKRGYKEIMLLGQNVNSYIGDTGGENFAKLLEKICKIEGKFRIRFTSPHPRDFTDELIDVISREEKICKSIHLPLQAGATDVLKTMNRGYTKEEYLILAQKIKDKIPEVALTTDIIVGFPGETEENFIDTLDVVEKLGYDNAYMFMYSKREGTPAAVMEGQIDEEIKKERLHRLIELQTKKSRIESERYLGKEEEILVEGKTPKNPKMYMGRTDTNKVVIFKGSDEIKGKFLKVKINEVKTWTLYGEVIC